MDRLRRSCKFGITVGALSVNGFGGSVVQSLLCFRVTYEGGMGVGMYRMILFKEGDASYRERIRVLSPTFLCVVTKYCGRCVFYIKYTYL